MWDSCCDAAQDTHAAQCGAARSADDALAPRHAAGWVAVGTEPAVPVVLLGTRMPVSMPVSMPLSMPGALSWVQSLAGHRGAPWV